MTIRKGTKKMFLEQFKKTLAFANYLLIVTVITIIFLGILELGAQTVISLRTQDKVFYEYWVSADAYKNESWINEYLKEFKESVGGTLAKWHSYVYWRFPEYKGKYINIDENGIRRTWKCNLPRDAKKIKIFMFGGSTMWGHGARDDYTIPSFISKILCNEGFTNIDITNFGETGYVNSQEMVSLILELRKGNIPDIAIFYDGTNDVSAAFQSGKAGLPANEYNRVWEFRSFLSTRELFKRFFQFKVTRSATYEIIILLKEKFTGPQIAENTSTNLEKLAFEVVQTYSSNIHLIQSLGKEYGFKTIFYWHPILYTKDKKSPFESKFPQRRWDTDREFFGYVYQTIKNDETLSNEKDFHDISDIFKSIEDPIYLDFDHISERGNYMVAERISQNIIVELNQTNYLESIQ